MPEKEKPPAMRVDLYYAVVLQTFVSGNVSLHEAR